MHAPTFGFIPSGAAYRRSTRHTLQLFLSCEIVVEVRVGVGEKTHKRRQMLAVETENAG